mgnify:CR=1 FL=1
MFEKEIKARNWLVHGSLTVKTVRETISAHSHEFSWEIVHALNTVFWECRWRECDLFNKDSEEVVIELGIMDDYGDLWEMYNFENHPNIDRWEEQGKYQQKTFEHSQVCVEGVYMDVRNPRHDDWLNKIKEHVGYCYKEDPIPTELPKESGWDLFADLATMDGMLCVRWLNWYESPPSQSKGNWYPHHCNQRVAARQILHEGVIGTNKREIAAEMFPIEIGSLQAQDFHDEGHVSIGLVLDLNQSEVREVYSTDCWSYEENGKLQTSQYNCWTTDVTRAREAYERIGVFKRLERRHTECFVSKSVPAALVVYGAKNQSDLDPADQILIRRSSKRLPVIFMQPTIKEN